MNKTSNVDETRICTKLPYNYNDYDVWSESILYKKNIVKDLTSVVHCTVESQDCI